MAQQNFSQLASLIWSVADLLRGDFKQSQYGRIILPFTLLRRLECVLEGTQDTAVAAHKKYQNSGISEEMMEDALLHEINNERKRTNKPELKFYNTSPLTFSTLSSSQVRQDLNHYIQSFSSDAREIFTHFNFDDFIDQLREANLLYKVVEKFAGFDLSLQSVSNHDMGLVFEELIRRFAESSNETAGEHFTPRDIVELTTSLVFCEDDAALTQRGIVRTIYDPTAGTGGFLSSGTEHVQELNAKAILKAYGQELNPESYAICKADMLIKGEDVQQIKLGNTLSQDQLQQEKFDYMLSNPPFGVDWKKIENTIKDEHLVQGEAGRFGAGLPRVSDGSLLFLMHLISKMRPEDAQHEQGSRIGIILNGSPLFTGSAGSGESEIRRSILEQDLLEAIIALPTDMFYNTGIATYIWILSNKKSAERQGKVQLIDGSHLYEKMRKSLGSKRHQISEADQDLIVRTFGKAKAVEAFELDKPEEQKSNRGRQSAKKDKTQRTFASKIFPNHAFGYRRVTIERPLRLSVALTDERISSLEFAPKPFESVMPDLKHQFGSHWQSSNYGTFAEADHEQIKAFLKANYPELKAKQVNTLLDPEIWQFQQQLHSKVKQLQQQLGTQQWDNWNQFETDLKKACKVCAIKLDGKESKQLRNACSWTNPEADPVVKKVLKEAAQPLYGAFAHQNKVVEFEQDGDLRDQETIALNPDVHTIRLIEDYFYKEVQPHVPDAWMNADKRDEKDGEIGIVGYEIPFNRHFYQYQPPRDLAEIDADLDAVSRDIMQLLQEVHV